jgi:flagella basal body P-ring formation protein FlgA
MTTGSWMLKTGWLWFGLTALTLAIADETIQPLATIQRQAYEFLVAQHRNRAEPPQIQLGDLDPRLRLAKCGAALEAFLPGGAQTVGNTSIGVRCPGPQPWTVYQRASVRVFDQVVVAGRFLDKGTILSAADFRLERRDLSQLSGGYETAPAALIGKQLRGALTAGAVIPPQAVKIIPAIRKGAVVKLVVRQGGMEITSSGIALSDAGLGERVQVRNEASKRVVEGTVIDNHRVEVGQ